MTNIRFGLNWVFAKNGMTAQVIELKRERFKTIRHKNTLGGGQWSPVFRQ